MLFTTLGGIVIPWGEYDICQQRRHLRKNAARRHVFLRQAITYVIYVFLYRKLQTVRTLHTRLTTYSYMLERRRGGSNKHEKDDGSAILKETDSQTIYECHDYHVA
ncbi:hypothetical protein Y032_1019g3406 [Ancylostoma ceylanicum]|uniref:Uncharacterized protein n=1 Tax=Ancylostoma ceylanicum TaxID=53326 RepID=A0A016W7N8_9BILA|nr:hypothetical protein Y032_1019g3406 [Ancylostoma ceylanicum]